MYLTLVLLEVTMLDWCKRAILWIYHFNQYDSRKVKQNIIQKWYGEYFVQELIKTIKQEV